MRKLWWPSLFPPECRRTNTADCSTSRQFAFIYFCHQGATMNSRTVVKRAGCMFLILCAAVTAPAATISSTYAYTAGVTGNLANPPLIGTGSGSIVPLGSMAWSDRAFPNLATGVSTGTFTMTFNNGTLFGDFRGQTDITTPPTATLLTQV